MSQWILISSNTVIISIMSAIHYRTETVTKQNFLILRNARPLLGLFEANTSLWWGDRTVVLPNFVGTVWSQHFLAIMGWPDWGITDLCLDCLNPALLSDHEMTRLRNYRPFGTVGSHNSLWSWGDQNGVLLTFVGTVWSQNFFAVMRWPDWGIRLRNILEAEILPCLVLL